VSKVVKSCNKLDINVPDDMDATYVQRKKVMWQDSSVSNFHYYKHDCLFSVIDLQLQELNVKFVEENTALLQCAACLSSTSSFVAFNVDKLLMMVKLYPNDFKDVGRGGAPSTSKLS